ncbi:DP-EP family protein [Alteromonas sp. C1M14]|uniref:DP-EP family protein n=1 Tax=Alteromonas sp. C1M14 TaxID=2841567 RepID=UPI001C081BF1|nr:DP-EP family protein [Alteromonas sp. C1M14]MBU2979692.1 DP-EP family protein [Alteromonas sp. C1M14]
MALCTYNYTVSVNTQKSPPVYTIYDSDDNPTDGPLSVKNKNTVITYTLNKDSNHLRFIEPEISGDPDHDLSYTLSADGQTLIIIDANTDEEDICLKLVTIPGRQTYISPDPQILNRPKS